MSQPEYQRHWGEFSRRLRTRLDNGHKSYGDKSFALPIEQQIDEIQQELEDVVGWSLILWGRLRNIQGNRSVKHGMWETPEYRAWQGMKDRCTNPNNSKYARYGARGIVVCDRWLLSFSDFISDMRRRPSPKHSLERLDNDGSYSPGNCIWATKSEQMRNRCTTQYYTHNGIRMSVQEWADEYKIPYKILWQRISRKWAFDKCLNTPVKARV